MRKIKQLYDAYNFPGFQVERKVAGVFGDPYTVVLRLHRRFSVLDGTKFYQTTGITIRPWRMALRDFLQKIVT